MPLTFAFQCRGPATTFEIAVCPEDGSDGNLGVKDGPGGYKT